MCACCIIERFIVVQVYENANKSKLNDIYIKKRSHEIARQQRQTNAKNNIKIMSCDSFIRCWYISINFSMLVARTGPCRRSNLTRRRMIQYIYIRLAVIVVTVFVASCVHNLIFIFRFFHLNSWPKRRMSLFLFESLTLYSTTSHACKSFED